VLVADGVETAVAVSVAGAAVAENVGVEVLVAVAVEVGVSATWLKAPMRAQCVFCAQVAKIQPVPTLGPPISIDS
jgi:hypothetical protein